MWYHGLVTLWWQRLARSSTVGLYEIYGVMVETSRAREGTGLRGFRQGWSRRGCVGCFNRSAVQRMWRSAMRSFRLIVECGGEFELEVTIAEAARFKIRFGPRVAVWWHTSARGWVCVVGLLSGSR